MARWARGLVAALVVVAGCSPKRARVEPPPAPPEEPVVELRRGNVFAEPPVEATDLQLFADGRIRTAAPLRDGALRAIRGYQEARTTPERAAALVEEVAVAADAYQRRHGADLAGFTGGARYWVTIRRGAEVREVDHLIISAEPTPEEQALQATFDELGRLGAADAQPLPLEEVGVALFRAGELERRAAAAEAAGRGATSTSSDPVAGAVGDGPPPAELRWPLPKLRVTGPGEAVACTVVRGEDLRALLSALEGQRSVAWSDDGGRLFDLFFTDAPGRAACPSG